MIKKIFAVLIACTVLTSSTSFATAGTDPQRVLQVVDEYIATMKDAQNPDDLKAQTFKPIGQADYLGKVVSTQLLSLQPEDFNIFLFYFMDRYIHHPEERKLLFDFTQLVRGMIKNDLDNTKALREGPYSFIFQGSYKYATWIFLGVSGLVLWRKILSSPARTAALVSEMKTQESAITSLGRSLRDTAITMNKPLLWVGVSLSGAAGGGLEYVLKTHSTHRLDPAEILMVVQSQLACEVSIEGLALEQRFEDLAKDDDQLLKGSAKLKTDISALMSQSKDLLDQFPRLTDLYVNDRLFKQTLQVFPQANNWAEYKKMLNDSDINKDGQCRQIALNRLTDQLSEMDSQIDTLTSAASPVPALEKKP